MALTIFVPECQNEVISGFKQAKTIPRIMIFDQWFNENRLTQSRHREISRIRGIPFSLKWIIIDMKIQVQ